MIGDSSQRYEVSNLRGGRERIGVLVQARQAKPCWGVRPDQPINTHVRGPLVGAKLPCGTDKPVPVGLKLLPTVGGKSVIQLNRVGVQRVAGVGWAGVGQVAGAGKVDRFPQASLRGLTARHVLAAVTALSEDERVPVDRAAGGHVTFTHSIVVWSRSL